MRDRQVVKEALRGSSYVVPTWNVMLCLLKLIHHRWCLLGLIHPRWCLLGSLFQRWTSSYPYGLQSLKLYTTWLKIQGSKSYSTWPKILFNFIQFLRVEVLYSWIFKISRKIFFNFELGPKCLFREPNALLETQTNPIRPNLMLSSRSSI